MASEAQLGIDPSDSLEEIIAAFRRQIDDCPVVDGVAPIIAPSTRAEKVSAGGMPSEWVLAEGADPDLRLMFIHGGGWIAGALDGYRHQVEALSRATGMAVLAIDYCLALEHPYPGGLNDCAAAWLWMLENGPSGAGAPDDVFLAGDSAGGNLAFALMLRLRDVDQRLPKAAPFRSLLAVNHVLARNMAPDDASLFNRFIGNFSQTLIR